MRPPLSSGTNLVIAQKSMVSIAAAEGLYLKRPSVGLMNR